MTSTALVVPCYNEALRLPTDGFLNYLQSTSTDVRFIFVDDGSTDATLDVLRRLASIGGERVAVLGLQTNRGKAEAVRSGMNYALNRFHVNVVGFWDADLATPLGELSPMLEVLKRSPKIDMVFAARVKLLGRRINRRPARHYFGRIFATAVSNVLALPVYDTQCGAKLFRVTPDLTRILAEQFLSRWVFDVEIIARFLRLRGGDVVEKAIYEYPLDTWTDVAGSKVGAGDFIRAALDVASIWRHYLAPSNQNSMAHRESNVKI